MKRSASWVLFGALASAVPARAEEPDVAATVRALREQIAAHDRAHGGNTIPIEKGFIRLRDARAGAELREFLEHGAFGFIAAWAASETGDPELGPAALAAFRKLDARAQAEYAFHLAAFRSDEVRAALKRSLAAARDAKAGDAFRAALLRAGDAEAEKEALAGLADADAAKCAGALLIVGRSRRDDLLDRVSALASDGRPVANVPRSRFAVRTATKTPEGGTSWGTEQPLLKTVGEVALEAANTCVLPTTPDMIAWWYETEVLPRFGRGAEGATALAAWVAEARKASEAKACSPAVAVAAALRFLRAQPDGDERKVRIAGVRFEANWTIRYRIGGSSGSEPRGEELTVVVGADGQIRAR